MDENYFAKLTRKDGNSLWVPNALVQTQYAADVARTLKKELKAAPNNLKEAYFNAIPLIQQGFDRNQLLVRGGDPHNFSYHSRTLGGGKEREILEWQPTDYAFGLETVILYVKYLQTTAESLGKDKDIRHAFRLGEIPVFNIDTKRTRGKNERLAILGADLLAYKQKRDAPPPDPKPAVGGMEP